MGMAFVSRTARAVVDEAVELDGRWVGLHGKLGLAELAVGHPDVELMEIEAAHDAVEACFVEGPSAVTRERFQEMLEVLPPVGHIVVGETESFAMCEHTHGRITAMFVRIGDRHWRLQARAGTSHAAAVASVRDAMAAA